ncbi:CD225/dispanin family protein [Candidatus Magnetomonas plexicatena]|nr:CD225/dispanin family protein [Nitrospirales bacterium LBB_01]
MAQTIPNYLVYSILVTLFCCLPTGIVAIVYSSQVSGKVASGDFQGAVVSSKKAKTWCWVSFGIGIVVTIAGVGLGIISALFKGN